MVEQKPDGTYKLVVPSSAVSPVSAGGLRDERLDLCLASLHVLKGLWNGRTALYAMPQERSIDIDSELDFQIVELLLAERRSMMTASHTVMLTGGGGIIGRAMTVALAEAGHRVAVVDRDTALASDAAHQVEEMRRGRTCDITDRGALQRLRAEVERISVSSTP